MSESSVFLMSSLQEMGRVHHSGDQEPHVADKHHKHTVKTSSLILVSDKPPWIFSKELEIMFGLLFINTASLRDFECQGHRSRGVLDMDHLHPLDFCSAMTGTFEKVPLCPSKSFFYILPVLTRM